MEQTPIADLARDLRQAAHDVNGKYRELDARFTHLEQKVARGDWSPADLVTTTLGSALVQHPEFPALAALAGRRGKMTLTLEGLKAITSLPVSAGALVPPDVRTDPVMQQRRRLIVRNLVGPGSTTSNSVEYPRQTVRDLNAAVVSEGAAKPESSIAFELTDAPVRTIAHWTKTSRQILADAPALRTTVDGELRYGVALAEETEMLFGDGTGQHLLGIVPQAAAFDDSLLSGVAFPNNFDVLAAAITQSEMALLPATGIVMNDGDLGKLRTIKNENGDYIASGGPFGPPITSIWGRPSVGTPVMPAGEFLVGAFFDGAQVYDREQVNVLVSTENEDDFVKNLATVLCEERLAFAVKRPQGFVYGDFPISSG